MNDTSIHRPLKRMRYLKLERWHLDICNNKQPAACLLAFLISYHNYRQDEKVRAELINEGSIARGKTPMWNDTDWQFHTDKLLLNGVLLFKMDALRQAITDLTDLQLIETDPPEEFRKRYKTGRTKWFKLNHEIINKWIESNYGILYDASDKQASTTAPEIEPATQNIADAVKRLFSYWQILFKKDTAKLDAKRQKLISTRLKTFSEFELAQAVLGNKFSKWHNGGNPDGKRYNEISLIFRDAEYIERFQTEALSSGYSVEEAKREYIATIPAELKTDWTENDQTDEPELAPEVETATEVQALRAREIASMLGMYIACGSPWTYLIQELTHLLNDDDDFLAWTFKQALTVATISHASELNNRQREMIDDIVIFYDKRKENDSNEQKAKS